MASAALLKWQQLLTQLQLLQSKLAAGQACDAADVRALQHAAAAAPKLDTVSTAQVKMIVIDQQVPLQLYTLLAALYPRNPQMGCIFATALPRTLELSYDINAMQPGQPLHSTAVSLWQQVLQSGLLLPPHLPGLVSATAEQVNAGLVIIGIRDCTSTCPKHGCGGGGGRSSRGNRQQGRSSRSGHGILGCSCVHDTATDLLMTLADLKLVYDNVQCGSSNRVGSMPAVVYAANMQLSLATIWAASRMAEGQAADWEGAQHIQTTFSAACLTAFCSLLPCHKILSGLDPLDTLQPGAGGGDSGRAVNAEQQLLLQSPHFIQGVALMLVMLACADLFTTAAAAAYRRRTGSGSSNGGSSNGGNSSNSGGNAGSTCSGGSNGGSSSNSGGDGGSSSKSGVDGNSSSGAGRSFSYASISSLEELKRRVEQQCYPWLTDNSSSSSNAFNRLLHEWQSDKLREKAWATAASRHELLPGAFKQQLQLLGCSSKVGVWGACRLANANKVGDLALPRARDVYERLVEGRHVMLLQAQQQGKLQPLMQQMYQMRMQPYTAPATQQQQQQQLRLLLQPYCAPATLDMQLHLLVQHVLLFWAGELPSCTDGLHAECYSTALSLDTINFRAQSVLERALLHFMQQHQQQQQDGGSSGSGQSLRQLTHRTGSVQRWRQQQQQAAMEAAAAELRPLLLRLLQRAAAALNAASLGHTKPAAAPSSVATAVAVTAITSGRGGRGKSSSSGSNGSSRRRRQDAGGSTNGKGMGSSLGSREGEGGGYDRWVLTLCQLLLLAHSYCQYPAVTAAAAGDGEPAATSTSSSSGTPAAAAAAGGQAAALASHGPASAAGAAVPGVVDSSSTWAQQLQQLAALLEPCIRQQLPTVLAAAREGGGLIDPLSASYGEPPLVYKFIGSVSLLCGTDVQDRNVQDQDGVLLQAVVRAGFESDTARHLLGILTSLLKASATLSSISKGTIGSSGSNGSGGSSSASNWVGAADGRVDWGPALGQAAELCRMTTATALMTLLSTSVLENGTERGSSGSGSGSGDDSSNENHPSKWAAVGPSALAPWLVLYGRCCLQWGRRVLSVQGTSLNPYSTGSPGDLKVFFKPVSNEGGGRVTLPLFLLLTQAVLVTLTNLKDSSSDRSRRDSSSSSDDTAVGSSGGEGIGSISSSIGDLSRAADQLLTVHKFVHGLHEAGILCAAPLQQFGGVLEEVGHLFCSNAWLLAIAAPGARNSTGSSTGRCAAQSCLLTGGEVAPAVSTRGCVGVMHQSP